MKKKKKIEEFFQNQKNKLKSIIKNIKILLAKCFLIFDRKKFIRMLKNFGKENEIKRRKI